MSKERELLARALEELSSQDAALRQEFEGLLGAWGPLTIMEEIRAYIAEPTQDEPVDISAKSGPTIAVMLPNGVAVSNVYEAYEAGLKEGNLQYENPVATLDHSGRFVLLKMVGIPIGQPMKLYEHPAPHPVIRLTDEEIKTLADSGLSPDWTDEFEIYHFARSVEDALAEKNNERSA